MLTSPRVSALRRTFPTVGLSLLLLMAAPGLCPAQETLPHSDDGDGLTLALAGDAIITRRLSVYDEPEFLALRELVQGATAAFVNLEMLLHNFEADVIPATESGGTYMQADPSMAKELAWMGFDMVNMANNHTGDYGYGALRRTTAAVESAGLVHAGTGENLAEARAPAYLETPRGRVALLAGASTFPDASRAGHQRKDVRGRPGLAPIRYDQLRQLTEDQMELLRDFQEATTGRRPSGDRLRLFGETFTVGPEYASLTTPNEEDLAEIVASVKAAAREADIVIYSGHSHERGQAANYPADFIRTVAHAVIDAGADIYVGHGPHILRGIELYGDGIIFYSVGDFLFQNETVPRQPWDNYERYGLGPEAVAADFYDARQRTGGFPAQQQVWESVVPLVRYENGALASVELHPITLGFGLPRPQRGRPLLATGELARKIIADVQEYSTGYGTEIAFRDGVGVVRVR
jgi:poly-gamma-glutamate capsule biosynthesis protein CapA/YwtB (metallophosphatase superfamily)